MQPDAERRGAASAARYDRWQATARFPRMIKDVYLVPPQRRAGRAAPPAALQPGRHGSSSRPSGRRPLAADPQAAARTPLPASGTAGSARRRPVVMRAMVPTVWPSVPALVDSGADADVQPRRRRSATRARRRCGWRRGALHRSCCSTRTTSKSEMLPALAQQHFQGTGDGFDYQLAVVPHGSEAGSASTTRLREFAPGAETRRSTRTSICSRCASKDFEPLVDGSQPLRDAHGAARA